MASILVEDFGADPAGFLIAQSPERLFNPYVHGGDKPGQWSAGKLLSAAE